MTNNNCLLYSILFHLYLICPHANAIDLQPGEIIAPPPNITYAQLSYISNNYNGLYSNHQRKNTDYHYNIQHTLIRAGQSFELLNKPAAIYAQLPISDYNLYGDLSRYKSDSGIGDITAMAALWPYSNREINTYLGIGAYFVIPTGSYNRNRMVNIGENREKFALQIGFQTPINYCLDLMTAIDGVIFGDNNQYNSNKTLSQNNLYTGQLGLRYKPNNRYSFSANFLHTEGGKKYINNISNHDEISTNRYQLTAQGDYPFGRITLTYGQDLNVKDGAKEEYRYIIRYTILF